MRSGPRGALSRELLNQLLADSMILSSHYKNHWLVRDNPSYELDLLLNEHAAAQRVLVDLIVERVEALGGTPTVPSQVAELTVITRPPKEAEQIPALLSRIVQVHELIISRIQDAITAIATSGDGETDDLLNVMLGKHETQLWLISEHVSYSSSLRLTERVSSAVRA